MSESGLRAVAFRFDAESEEDAALVINAIQAAGIKITPNHSARRKKRGDPGVFWDGQISVPVKQEE